jgi:hypothetical protein
LVSENKRWRAGMSNATAKVHWKYQQVQSIKRLVTAGLTVFFEPSRPELMTLHVISM